VILQLDCRHRHDRQNVGGKCPATVELPARRHDLHNKFSLDGIDITDMAATGSSPTTTISTPSG
jgi:hypothetical protein